MSGKGDHFLANHTEKKKTNKNKNKIEIDVRKDFLINVTYMDILSLYL